jgi:hypothetical protein
MKIDVSQVRAILDAVLDDRKLTPPEAGGVIAIAWLAVDADHREDDDEVASLDAIGAEVHARAGIPKDAPIPPVTPVPMDDEEMAMRLDKLAPGLGAGAREAGYALAYALIVVDFELAVGESAFLTMLRDKFQLSDERVLDLSVAVGEAVTPLDE